MSSSFFQAKAAFRGNLLLTIGDISSRAVTGEAYSFLRAGPVESPSLTSRIAMPRRPREPLNSPMRAELRKRLRRIVPPPVAEVSTTPSVDDGFQDTDICTWVRIPEDLDENAQSVDAVTGAQQLVEKGSPAEEGVKDFCRLLASLKADFEGKGRPYAALAAEQGIQLVREGKQDDINPGLWAFVSAREKAMKEPNNSP